MKSGITNLHYIERNVGGTVKTSKKQHIWEFTIDNKDERVEFFDSHLSFKRKVIVNGQLIYDKQDGNQTYFNLSFQLDGHNVVITKTFDRVDLRIDSESFEHIYHLERNKLFYNKNPEPTVYSTVSKTVDTRNNFNLRDNFYSHQNKNLNFNQPQLFNFKITNGKGQQNNFARFKFGGDDNNTFQNNQNNFNQQQGNVNQINIQNNNNDNQSNPKTGNLLDFDEPDNNNNLNVQQSNNDLLSDIFGGGENNNVNDFNGQNQYQNNVYYNNNNFIQNNGRMNDDMNFQNQSMMNIYNNQSNFNNQNKQEEFYQDSNNNSNQFQNINLSEQFQNNNNNNLQQNIDNQF